MDVWYNKSNAMRMGGLTMKKTLIVVDMQNDFITMALGTKEAVAIVPMVKAKIQEYAQNGDEIIFTRDTHFENYMDTQEGKNLPVSHCIKGTEGWQICAELEDLRTTEVIDKITFGSKDLIEVLKDEEDIESITFVGLCTDICVISNAMIVKAFYPEIPLLVDAKGCAGVTPESHQNALNAMKMCQIKIMNE